MQNSFLKQISGDNALWHSSAYETYPSIIAHEYWRLNDLCKQEEPYGVLFQIKDVYEVVLKFAVLTVCAWGVNIQDDEFLNSVVCLITSQNLSMGAWVQIGDDAINYYLDRNEISKTCIFSLLKKIVVFYKKKKIVNWRNEKIGHGALGFAEDDYFQRDVIDQISRIKEIFEITEAFFLDMKVFCEKDILHGYKKARKLNSNKQIWIKIEKDNMCFTLDPFIELIDNTKTPENSKEIFIYDNQSRNKKVVLQSYSSGCREKIWNNIFLELSTRRHENNGTHFDYSVDSKGITVDEEEYINKIEFNMMGFEFVTPITIIEWLKEVTTKNKCGLYLLQMGRGTGKSTLCAKLNCLYDSPLVINPQLDVRTYHFYRTQLTGADDFEREIERQWSNSFGQAPRTRDDRIIDFRNRGMSKSEAFIAYLKQIRDITRQFRHKTGIMMVLDGVDEIKESATWDYLNFKGKELPEGIFILVTSRTPDDFPVKNNTEFVKCFNKRCLSETKIIHRKQTEYRSFLDDYTNQTLNIHLSKSSKEKLYQLSEYRIVYLALLYTLINSGISEELLLEQGESSIQAYLDILYKKYGEVQFNYLQEIIIVLSSFGVLSPLTIKDIAELTRNEGIVTIDLLGKISDISPFLKKQYGNTVDKNFYHGDNRYQIVNETIAQKLMGKIDSSVNYVVDCIKSSKETLVSFQKEEIEAEYSVWTALMVAAEMFQLIPKDQIREIMGGQTQWMEFVINTGEKLISKANIKNLNWIFILVKKSLEYYQTMEIEPIYDTDYRAFILLTNVALSKGDFETAFRMIEKAKLCINENEEYKVLSTSLLEAKGLVNSPDGTLEGEALIYKEMRNYKKYDDLYIKANLILINIRYLRQNITLPGIKSTPLLIYDFPCLRALNRIAKIRNITQLDRDALLEFINEYLYQYYRSQLSFPRTKIGKWAIRRKISVLCRLTLGEEYENEFEKIIKMSRKSSFIYRVFTEDKFFLSFAKAYLGKEKANEIRFRIIEQMMMDDDNGMIPDRSVLGKLILENARHYHQRANDEEQRIIEQLYRARAIFTAIKNNEKMTSIDYENLCECQYLLIEYEQKQGVQENESEKSSESHLRRIGAENLMSQIRSMEARLQNCEASYGGEEERKLNYISILQNNYDDVILESEKDEMKEIKNRTRERKRKQRMLSIGSNTLVWIMTFAFIYSIPQTPLGKGAISVITGIAGLTTRYLASYSLLKKSIDDKKYLRKLVKESIEMHTLVMLIIILIGIFSFISSLYPSIFEYISSGLDLSNRNKTIVMAIMLIVGGIEFIQELHFIRLNKAWRRIRKWSNTIKDSPDML